MSEEQSNQYFDSWNQMEKEVDNEQNQSLNINQLSSQCSTNKLPQISPSEDSYEEIFEFIENNLKVANDKKKQQLYDRMANNFNSMSPCSDIDEDETIAVQKIAKMKLINLPHKPSCVVLFGILLYNLGGNLQFNDEDQSCDVDEEDMGFKVIQIEKKHQRFFIQLQQGYFEQLDDDQEKVKFIDVINKLESCNDTMKYEQAQLLKQLRLFYYSYANHLELVKIYHQENPKQLRNIQNMRIEQLKEQVLQTKQLMQFESTDFVSAMYLSPDFSLKIQSVHSMEVNLPFVSLIGVSEEEFITISIRSGLECWFGDSSTIQFNNAVIKGLLAQQPLYYEVLEGQHISTVDDFTLTCKTHFFMIHLNQHQNQQLNVSGSNQNNSDDLHSFLPIPLQPILDYAIMMKYEIETRQIQELLHMRSQNINRDNVDGRLNSVTYQIHSEIFMDKYYQDVDLNLKEGKGEQKQQQQQEKQQYLNKNDKNQQSIEELTLKTCGFKAI